MPLDQLAQVFRIEKIHEALGGVGRRHELAVVGDRTQMRALVAVEAVGIEHVGRYVLGHVLRDERRQPPVPLPGDEVRGIGAVHHVGAIDLARHLLRNAIEHALCAGTLDSDLDARELRLEGLGHGLGNREVHRGVVADLAFFLRRLDQRRRHGLGRGHRRHDPRTEWDKRCGLDQGTAAHR